MSLLPTRGFASTMVIGATAGLMLLIATRQADARVANPPASVSDSSDVLATVARFHSALAAGDSAGALAILSVDALILESGAIENRADYRAHHLPADIEFARAVPSTRQVARVTVKGDAAWVTSTSTAQGQANGRQVNSTGAELVVLQRAGTGWQIVAIHWSSRTRRPPG